MLIHLVGVGGTGMGNLAVLLSLAGHRVRGSDAGIYPPMDSILRDAHVEMVDGYHPRNLSPTPDLVVVGNVCRPDHPEARAALERGLNVASMTSTLKGLVLRGRRPLVVAGTHGKTTTSALLVHLLSSTGVDPGFLVGGRIKGRASGASHGNPPWFVLEGDEYDSAFFEKRAKFLSYDPDGLIVTSVEHDHADIYPTWNAYREAFERLASGMGHPGCLVACADSEPCRRLTDGCLARSVTYSLDPRVGADYTVLDIEERRSAMRFRIDRRGADLGRFEIPLAGKHNAANTTASIALALEHVGADLEALRESLPSFPGVMRRQESAGAEGGVEVIDDFGHHPTAIGATLGGLRASLCAGGRLIAVLRPASATACRSLHQQEYSRALASADIAILAPLARRDIPIGERLDLEKLARDIEERGASSRIVASLDEIPAVVSSLARDGDTVIFFSNTDPGTLLGDTLARLSRSALARREAR